MWYLSAGLLTCIAAHMLSLAATGWCALWGAMAFATVLCKVSGRGPLNPGLQCSRLAFLECANATAASDEAQGQAA